MMLIPCPWCGPRNQIEFTYGGDATVRRPPPDAPVSREGPPRPTDQAPGGQRAERAWGDQTAAWVDYVYFRDNPAGPLDELWYHGAGCRSWFHVLRNTRTHEILASAPVGEAFSR
jgi:heterotetrameric sarcosine oxidase delta subunit